MTSQIVIMNQLGFTLASDSAVSSGKFSSNSVQKIFSLPGRQPVAFMVMGSGVHASSGLSWDRVFHKYHQHFIRTHGKNQELTTMDDYLKDFAQFLEMIISKKFNGFALQRDLHHFFTSEKNYIWDGVKIGDSPEYSANPDVAVKKFHDNINSTLGFFKNKIDGNVEKNYQINQVKQKQIEKLKETAADIISYGSNKFNNAIPADAFQEVMVDFLTHHLVHFCGDDDWKDTSSTVILAGFGGQEEFPSYLSIKSASVVAGLPTDSNVVRSVVSPFSSVNPEVGDDGIWESRVFMESFAMKSFTSRITTGMDEKFTNNQKISKEVQNIIVKWFEEKGVNEFSKVSGVGETTAQKLVEHVLKVAGLPWEVGQEHWNWVCEGASDTKKDFRNAVNRLSPIDLSKMATHLIETEAIMSSFVSPNKYVDLPVDCCYVTKENGFVWRSLKNVPDSKINPKVFSIERNGTLFF